MQEFQHAIPLSLYVHLPWCIQKCPYCDFNSHTLRDSLPEAIYIKRLMSDLHAELPKIWGRPIQTIFIGGGTPSLFSPEAIDSLLQNIRACLTLAPQAEITLEANPGTTEQQRFNGFLQAGVNRLSIGIQSLNEQQLNRLGRIHNSKEALTAVTQARLAGNTNLNLDMMFGLPEQSIEEALLDLQELIELSPDHISWYQLTLEPNTAFYVQPPKLPEDDLCADIQWRGQRLLANAGFHQYEISAYSKTNPCQHNLNYWRFGDYLGIGAGAHSKITDFATQSIQRWNKHRHPKQYLSDTPSYIAQEHVVDIKDVPFEFMLNALRLYELISFDLFEQHTGLARKKLTSTLEYACKQGLMSVDTKGFCLTELGHRFYNDVVTLFMPKT